MELGSWFLRCKTNRPNLKVIQVVCMYFVLFISVCQFSYMKANPNSVYTISRGPFGNACFLMQLAYETQWVICVAYC